VLAAGAVHVLTAPPVRAQGEPATPARPDRTVVTIGRANTPQEDDFTFCVLERLG
jgi:hypothetical protein